MLVAPAMDRIITQFSSPEIKQHLEMYKEKVLYSIENLEKSQQKQPEILTLTNDAGFQVIILDVIFNDYNEILTPSIISAQLKDEIQSIIADSQKIVEDENTRIETFVELQRLDSREEGKKLIASQSEPEPESEPEPGNNGNGGGNGNGNSDGNGNGNGKDNGKDDNKGKGKK